MNNATHEEFCCLLLHLFGQIIGILEKIHKRNATPSGFSGQNSWSRWLARYKDTDSFEDQHFWNRFLIKACLDKFIFRNMAIGICIHFLEAKSIKRGVSEGLKKQILPEMSLLGCRVNTRKYFRVFNTFCTLDSDAFSTWCFKSDDSA